jgi:hypothetical protein
VVWWNVVCDEGCVVEHPSYHPSLLPFLLPSLYLVLRCDLLFKLLYLVSHQLELLPRLCYLVLRLHQS